MVQGKVLKQWWSWLQWSYEGGKKLRFPNPLSGIFGLKMHKCNLNLKQWVFRELYFFLRWGRIRHAVGCH